MNSDAAQRKMPGKRVSRTVDRYYFSGARVRLERKRRGLSLKRLAASIGVARSFLAQIELGRRKPSLETFERLLKVFNDRPESLLKATAAGKDLPLKRRISSILKGQPKDRRDKILLSLRSASR